MQKLKQITNQTTENTKTTKNNIQNDNKTAKKTIEYTT